MPIRGTRNPMPKAGGKPSGIFSTRGKQKMDSTDSSPHKGVLKYSRKHDRKKPAKGGK